MSGASRSAGPDADRLCALHARDAGPFAVCYACDTEMIGSTVCHYRILAEIGRGGMARVYKAQDTRLGRLAAVKIVAEKYSENHEALKRFEREGLAAASLNHPHICTIYEMGEWEGQPFIAMELLEGKTVRDCIRQQTLFEEDELTKIAIQITGALEAAHAKNILHRDIKPANIFLDQRGQAKLLDFGLAKITTRKPTPALTATMATVAMSFATIPGTILGTFAYMAPEQARGAQVDARADLYSLGVVLHEMATGELPLGGATRSSRLPTKLRPILQRLIAATPSARYQSASQLLADLIGSGE